MISKWTYGIWRMAGFILRRDRVQLPVWILAITLATVGMAAAFPGLYPTADERAALAITMNNPAIVAMVGPAYGIDDYTYGAMVAHQTLLFMALAVAVMNILLVTRHTRTDEEHGRLEVIRSLPVGPLANLAATLLVMGLANVVLGLLVGLGLFALGIESMDLSGSLVFGAAMGVTGLVFAGLTALFAQLTETSRGTLGISFGVFGIAYLVRAMGDMGTETLSLLSPLGLILRTKAYVSNVWWPICVLVGIALLVSAGALGLSASRDLGAGVLRARPGKRHAGKLLQTPLGLALRLQRTTIVGWTLTSLVLGGAYGSVFGDLESFFNAADVMKQLLPLTEGFTLAEQFASVILLIMAIVSTIPAVLVIMRLYNEERAHRIDPVLAGSVGKEALIGSYLGLAVVVSVLSQLAAALGLGLTSGAVMADPVPLGTVVGAAMAYLPAIWTVMGIAALFVGLRPKISGLTWIYLVYTFLVLYLGGLLQLPGWMEKLTPFGYVPQIPVESMRVAPLALLMLIAAVSVAVGIIGYRRRDVAS